jgi:hypothetical protein
MELRLDSFRYFVISFLAYFSYFEKIKVGLSDHVAVCVYPRIVATQRLGKSPLTVARQRLRKNVTVVTNTHSTIEELSNASFSMWSVSYQSK